MNLRGVVLLVAVLAAVAAAIPVPSFRWRRNPKPRLVAPKPIGKRWQDGVDCTTDTAGTKNTPGLMFAVGSDGENLPCDQLDAASTSSGVKCYKTNTDPESLGDLVVCPGDAGKPENPETGEGTVQTIAGTFCSTSGGGNALTSILQGAACSILSASGDPAQDAETGGTAICDALTAGSCTFFQEVPPATQPKECVDDPGSNVCDFAGPGK